jgi:hypothetical protein
VVGALPGRTFVIREAGGPTRVVRSRQTLAFLRGPRTREEVASRIPGVARP